MLKSTSNLNKKENSNEALSAAAIIGLGILTGLIVGAYHYIKFKRQRAKAKKTRANNTIDKLFDDQTKLVSYLRKYYPDICNFIKNNKSGDSFYFKKEIDQWMSPIKEQVNYIREINRAYTFLKTYSTKVKPLPGNYTQREYMDCVLTLSDEIREATDKFDFRSSSVCQGTFEKMGFLDANNVITLIDLFGEHDNLFNQATARLYSICSGLRMQDSDIGKAITECFDHSSLGNSDRSYGEYQTTLEQLSILLKHVKLDFDKYQKENKNA